MQGQKNSRKQKTYKENHNARSSNTQHANTLHDQATRTHAQRITHIQKCKMQNAKTKTNMHNRKQKQISTIK